MVRNLSMVKGFSSRPGRCWRKKTGRPIFRATSSATPPSTGASSISARAETMTSKVLLSIFAPGNAHVFQHGSVDLVYVVFFLRDGTRTRAHGGDPGRRAQQLRHGLHQGVHRAGRNQQAVDAFLHGLPTARGVGGDN